MAFDFPSSPTNGLEFTPSGGPTYVYVTATGVWTVKASLSVAAPLTPTGRLTLVSNTPVPSTNSNGVNTIYWTPYLGGAFPFFDGTLWSTRAPGQISALSTDTSKSPAAIGVAKVNDWFLWDDAGTIRLSHGPDWTNDTTRSAGTALVAVNGILMNNAAITNGPAASRGVYVGTTRSNNSSLFQFYFGSNAVGGSDGKFYVWNMYNRVNFASRVTDDTTTWTYATNTPRMLNNSGQNRISFVLGLQEESMTFSTRIRMQIGAAGAAGSLGLTLDGTGSLDHISYNQGNSGDQFGCAVTAILSPSIGAHFVQATENADAGLSITFVGGGQFSGLFGQLRI